MTDARDEGILSYNCIERCTRTHTYIHMHAHQPWNINKHNQHVWVRMTKECKYGRRQEMHSASQWSEGGVNHLAINQKWGKSGRTKQYE